VENTKDKYEEALAVLHKYNSTYVDDMTEVFARTQDFEEKRLRFFKDILIGIHGCLDISRSNEYFSEILFLVFIQIHHAIFIFQNMHSTFDHFLLMIYVLLMSASCVFIIIINE